MTLKHHARLNMRNVKLWWTWTKKHWTKHEWNIKLKLSIQNFNVLAMCRGALGRMSISDTRDMNQISMAPWHACTNYQRNFYFSQNRLQTLIGSTLDAAAAKTNDNKRGRKSMVEWDRGNYYCKIKMWFNNYCTTRCVDDRLNYIV